jgi:hypothetical protein
MSYQDKLISKIFDGSSRSAKELLGGSFHDLHVLANAKIKEQQKEIEGLQNKIKEQQKELEAWRNEFAGI